MHQTEAMPRTQWSLLMLCWLVALLATLGSLFFSEVMTLEPCVLCWYQRIAMFPLVPILAIGLYTQDPRSMVYAFPIPGAGWLAALYHSLLYAGYIPRGMEPCGKSRSCAEGQLELAGLVSIPLLSLIAFSIIVSLLVAARKDAIK